MTDYISRADAVKTVIRKCSPICDWQDGTQHYPDCVVAEINALPSADAVHGEWVCKEREYNDCDGHYAYYWYECSVCGARPPKDTWKNEWHSNFCPSCGARMKGGDDE